MQNCNENGNNLLRLKQPFLISYICNMRLLLILILTSFQFIAPFRGHAEVMASKEDQSISKFSGNELKTYYLITKPSADVTTVTNFRNSSSQYRQHSFFKFFGNTDLAEKSTAYKTSRFFTSSCLYCKSIGLLLIFPEHYFW